MDSVFVLAADVGATHSRIVVVPAGARVEQLTAHQIHYGAGYNVRASGDSGRDCFFAAVGHALSTLPPGASVSAVHFGISGAGPAKHTVIESEVRTHLTDLCAERCIDLEREKVRVSDDLVTAYVSAFDTAPPRQGILLLAGSGAGAVRYSGTREERRIDAMGWLLGDVGSGIWLGRRALEAAAADVDQRGPATALTARVLNDLGIDPANTGEGPVDLRQQMIARAYELAPAGWGTFAPHVSALAGASKADAVAKEIAAEATTVLLDRVASLAPEGPDAVLNTVVLAGSVLTADGPIGQLVRYALERDGFRVRIANVPLYGAAALALRALAENSQQETSRTARSSAAEGKRRS